MSAAGATPTKQNNTLAQLSPLNIEYFQINKRKTMEKILLQERPKQRSVYLCKKVQYSDFVGKKKVAVHFKVTLLRCVPVSQANQPMTQKLEETCCVKIFSYRIFLGIAGLSFPRSNFYIPCHLKILGLTQAAILIVKPSGCRYLFGHKSLVKSVA